MKRKSPVFELSSSALAQSVLDIYSYDVGSQYSDDNQIMLR